MSKVLVTGGCGFLGSHVCELFKARGWEVLSYDNLTKFEYSRAFKDVDKVREYNLRFLESIEIPTIIDDIRNEKMLLKAMNNCDLVVNCAAQPAMTIAMENPKLDFDVNVKGYLNILEACNERGIPVVNCSTIHVYGNEGINSSLKEKETRFDLNYYFVPWTDDATYEELDEEAPLLNGTITPLHASKRTQELYTQAYVDTYGLKAASFRLTGIYGPRQFGGEDHGWVANFTIKTLLEQSIKVFGTDKQVRDILYVKDAARAFYDWYINGCPSGIYNIGGGTKCATSIRELLNMLKTHTGKESEEELLPRRHGDLWWFISDYTQAKEAFDWKPTTYPLEGLWKLIKWVEDNKELFE